MSHFFSPQSLCQQFLAIEGITFGRRITLSTCSYYSPIVRANTTVVNELPSKEDSVTSVDLYRCTPLHLRSYDWGILEKTLLKLPNLQSLELSCLLTGTPINPRFADAPSNRIQHVSIFMNIVETGVYGGTAAILADVACSLGKEDSLNILGKD